jgi:hypothetical protein
MALKMFTMATFYCTWTGLSCSTTNRRIKDDNDAFQQISLTHPLTVKEPPPDPIAMFLPPGGSEIGW